MDPQSLNSYSYARNNPIILSDPSGLDWGDRIRGGAETGLKLIVGGLVIAAILATAEITIPATVIIGLSTVGVATTGYGAYKNEQAYSNGLITENQRDYNQGSLFVGGAASVAGFWAGMSSFLGAGKTVSTVAENVGINSKYVTKIAGVKVDYFGKTYEGTVDLGPTLGRINVGQKLSQFKQDGSIFENRLNNLPQKPNGYYSEYVVPTGTETGPGAQRIVVGQNGERYYTPDHYKSFINLNINQ